MSANALSVSEKSDKIMGHFHRVLMKANKERPRQSDIEALRDLLDGNTELKLWEAIVGMGALAESQVLDTIVNGSGKGMRECWRRRLDSLRADLGYADSSGSWDFSHYGFRTRESVQAGHKKPVGDFPFDTRVSATDAACCGFSAASWQSKELSYKLPNTRDLLSVLRSIRLR